MTSVKNQIFQEFGRELGKYKTPKEPKEASLEHKRDDKEHSVQFKNKTETPVIQSVSQNTCHTFLSRCLLCF